MRPSWDAYHMNSAWAKSLRSTCRVKVGAVVTVDNREVASGYAGSPPGQPHCTEVGCLFYGYMDPETLHKYDESGIQYQPLSDLPFKRRCMRTIHAEKNIAALCSKHGIPIGGGCWYTYPFGPCHDDQMLLIQMDAKRVVYPEPPKGFEHYRESPVLEAAGIEVVRLDPRDYLDDPDMLWAHRLVA